MPIRHILNTRPADRAAQLSRVLRTAGYQVSELPLLAFHTLTLSEAEQQMLHAVQAGDVIIVVSPMAAQLGLAWLAAHPSPVWQQVRWVAVGVATAQVLAIAGFVAQVPERANSEGVLGLPEIAQLRAPARVLVWRGEGGRELIQETLLQRGVALCSVAFYRRELPASSVQGWQTVLATSQPDAVLISSGEAWQHWCRLAGEFATLPTLLVYGDHLQRQLAPQVEVLALPSLQPDQVLAVLQANH
jgi:uroporphyrinogen-III synthase